MKQQFLEGMTNLLWSWGGDTPSEAIWAGNEFLKFYEQVRGVKLPYYLIEDDVNGQNSTLVDWIDKNT